MPKKRSYSGYFSLLFCLFFISYFNPIWRNNLLAQTPAQFSVILESRIEKNPLKIVLRWNPDTLVDTYELQRKLNTDFGWSKSPIIKINGTDSIYEDTNNVKLNVAYEYRIIKNAKLPNGTPYKGYGYILSGIELKDIENRGIVLLIIEDRVLDSIAAELKIFKDDLESDGFTVFEKIVPTDAKPSKIRDDIINLSFDMRSSFKNIILIGHVPVPYSGSTNPDGHIDHLGAWPADVYYGELDDNWTDQSVRNDTAARTENRNIAKDGKFDQSFLGSGADIAVGRIDLKGMNADFDGQLQTEFSLLRNYFYKNHRFRRKIISAERRGFIDDNFGIYGMNPLGNTPFSSSGWRNFGPIFGIKNVSSKKYLSDAKENSYLFGYGCGPGSYQSCGGIGSTTDFINTDPKVVFNFLFGSYFGDWDINNSFLRAPLALKSFGLTSAWAGRPYWVVHPMGLGFSIGECLLLTQNNSSRYLANSNEKGVTIALMGDPTLRLHMITPPKNLKAIKTTHNRVELKWESSTEYKSKDFLGYHVYRFDSSEGDKFGRYKKISQAIIVDTAYIDSFPHAPMMNNYMVKAVKLEEIASGTYFNVSHGIKASVYVETGRQPILSLLKLQISPNPTSDFIYLKIESEVNGFDLNKINSYIISTYDQVGKKVQTDEINSINRGINVMNLPEGMYVSKIEANDGNSGIKTLGNINWIKSR